MNKWRLITASLLSVAILATSFFGFTLVHAADGDAPSQVQSTNYGIQSIIFGNTGVVTSYSASVPPVFTAKPTVSNITLTTATVSWSTDKASTSIVFFGFTPGVYTTQISGASTTLVQNHVVNLERLTRGTTYYIKVRSVDVDGNVLESTETSFDTDPGDIIPPVITGPSISLDSASLVTVTWTTNELASTVVEYGVKAPGENSVGPADDLTLFHQVHISGLTPAQAYLIRVKSKDASGNISYSPTQTLATPNSPFISGFTITDVTLTSAVVQWTTSTSSTTKAEYGVASSKYDNSVDDASYSTTHIVRLSNLASGTTYYLRISGVDQAGNLLQSDEKIFATVVIPQITELKVTNITADGAILSWKSSSPVDELLRYEITDHPDKTFIGKKFSGGTDKLITEHKYELTDLESSATYSVSVLGKDIFGNQASSPNIKFTTLQDSTPPVISNIQSDTTIDLGSSQTAQVLVSLELSELGKVVINYGPGASGDFDKKVETDISFSRAKFLVIPGLTPGLSYHYEIVARDRVGNEAHSPEYLALIPKPQVSLIGMIFQKVSDNFGWMKRL